MTPPPHLINQRFSLPPSLPLTSRHGGRCVHPDGDMAAAADATHARMGELTQELNAHAGLHAALVAAADAAAAAGLYDEEQAPPRPRERERERETEGDRERDRERQRDREMGGGREEAIRARKPQALPG